MVSAAPSTTSASMAATITMVFGEQLGGQRAAIDITLDAVKEFQVVASGANANLAEPQRRHQCHYEIGHQ